MFSESQNHQKLDSTWVLAHLTYAIEGGTEQVVQGRSNEKSVTDSETVS